MPPELLTLLGQGGPVVIVGAALLWASWKGGGQILAMQQAQQQASDERFDKLIADGRAETAAIIARYQADTASMINSHRDEMHKVIEDFGSNLGRITSAITDLTSEVKSLSDKVSK